MKRFLLGMAAMVALFALPLLAGADGILNDVVADGNDTITAGGSTTINYRIVANGEDGCNVDALDPALITIVTPADVTATPGSLSFTMCQDGDTKNQQPVSFTSSVPGEYDITVTVSGGKPGNNGWRVNPADFTLTVEELDQPAADTTPPVITKSIPGTPVYPEDCDPNTDACFVNSDTTIRVNVEDPESDLTCTITVTGPNGYFDAPACGEGDNDFTLDGDDGDYEIAVTATSDGGQNDDPVTITLDNSAPNITVTTPPEGATYLLNEVVNADYTCDDGTGSGVASCDGDVANGSPIDTSTVGAHTFSVVSEDNLGNKSDSATHNYSVVFDFDGFFSPLKFNGDDGLNQAKAGSAIPIKFSLNGDQGLGIITQIQSVPIACDASDPMGDVAAATNPGGSSLSYDSLTDEYNFVWKTEKGWAGTCRELQLTLTDGTVHAAQFKFK